MVSLELGLSLWYERMSVKPKQTDTSSFSEDSGTLCFAKFWQLLVSWTYSIGSISVTLGLFFSSQIDLNHRI